MMWPGTAEDKVMALLKQGKRKVAATFQLFQKLIFGAVQTVKKEYCRHISVFKINFGAFFTEKKEKNAAIIKLFLEFIFLSQNK